MEVTRKPEFHLYLFSFDGTKKDIINANTISECEERGRMYKDIDTYQVMACTTTYLVDGYRIFIHPNKRDCIEITLGTCNAFGERELRPSHDLPRLIVSTF